MIEMEIVTIAGIYSHFSKIIKFFDPPSTCTRKVESFSEINIKSFNSGKCLKNHATCSLLRPKLFK